MDAFWIILTGSLVAVSCGLLGCYLVLRKMAMLGDAISHAVLPGIVLAFLITGSRDSVTMVIGAGLLGLVTTFLIEFFHRKGKLQSDAAIGVTFTWLFAIGIILISYKAGKVDLDQDCVLYGEIAFISLNTINLFGYMIPKAALVMGSVLFFIILFIRLGYKELFLTTFDPSYAAAIGISTALWHYLLMGMVSFTTVAAFENVGAILVVAFLIAPAATAYLITHKFRSMIWIAALLGVTSSAGGYYLAVYLDGSIAGAMSTVAGLQFMLALLFSPDSGLITKRFRKDSEEPVKFTNLKTS
jgi:manganese/zinc/iron transport system permease protein